MTRGEAVNWLINIMADIGKAEHSELWHYEQALSEIREILESEPERKKGKWSNKDWIDFLSEMFEVSRTSARDMLHVMMQVKKEDNFKKQFSGIRRQNESTILSK